MRTVLTLILLCMLSASTLATDLKVTWDPMPSSQAWTAVRLYEKLDTGMTKVGETSYPSSTPSITITNVTPGQHTYVLRSFNGQQESPDSTTIPFTLLVAPVAPTGGTITVIVK